MRSAVLALSLASVSARLLHSLPEDIHAFPKYSVEFLNGLPVLNETAHKWLRNGLRGGELEFLDQPWEDKNSHSRKEIDSGDFSPVATPTPVSSSTLVATNYTLEHMKMGPRPYICLIPQPLSKGPSPQEDVFDDDLTTARSWSLLQPLSGTCLYHRQGWFTYSYCHNDEIRQFREIIPAQVRFPGTYIPEEDPEREAYTLGRAPRNLDSGADLTVREQNTHTTNLELARSPGSRYLVQRWGDGTICDMTGKSREVEVQFHCSMEMTDHILFVKETKTCSYVLVIHTPRLCVEPGFKSRRDAEEQARIRCREVVDKIPEDQAQLPPAEHPINVPLRKTVLPTPKLKEKAADGSESKQDGFIDDILRKTLQALVSGQKGDRNAIEEEDVIIEFVDADVDTNVQLHNERIVEALRAAGYAEVIMLNDDLASQGDDKQERDKEKETAVKDVPAEDLHHDEL